MNIWLVLLLGLLFYLVVPFVVIMFVKNKRISNIITICLTVVFLIVVFLGIYCNVVFDVNKVFIKFNFSGQWCNKPINWSLLNISKLDFIINITMLIPIGIICRYFTANKNIRHRILLLLIVAVISGILTELGQYVLPIQRSVQLSDCLLNILSVVIGGAVASFYYILKKAIFKNH